MPREDMSGRVHGGCQASGRPIDGAYKETIMTRTTNAIISIAAAELLERMRPFAEADAGFGRGAEESFGSPWFHFCCSAYMAWARSNVRLWIDYRLRFLAVSARR